MREKQKETEQVFMIGEGADKDQVSMMGEETAQIMCSQMDAIQSQGGQRVLLT